MYRKQIPISVRAASAGDILAAARIYRDAFPSSLRAVAGVRVCYNYLTSIAANNNYVLLTAVDGEEVLGCTTLHLNRREKLCSYWKLRSLHLFFVMILKRPLWAARHLARVAVERMGRLSVTRSKGDALHQEGYPAGYQFADMRGLAVREVKRRMGLGKAIVTKCIEVALEHDLRGVELIVDENNVAAMKLYRSLGFSEVASSPKKNPKKKSRQLCLRYCPNAKNGIP